MMVRMATIDDQSEVVPLMIEAAEYSGILGGHHPLQIPYEVNQAVNVFRLHISLPNACVLVLESQTEPPHIVGILMGVISRHMYGDVLIAKESVWYIKPENRGSPRGALAMIRAYEEWAKSLGCAAVGLSDQEQFSLAPLYGRMDYHPVERFYMKAI